MRFVPTHCLRESMVLGNVLFGKNNEILLTKGVTLTAKYIDSIIKMQVNGIYIDDDISADIEIATVISETMKMKAVKGIREIFIQSEKGRPQSGTIVDLLSQVEDIVTEILENKNLMVNMIDLKVFDNYTYYHSVNVAVLSLIMGVASGLPKDELVKLGLGALLHDIGKVFVDKDTLNKKGVLSSFEFDLVKEHSLLGYKYAKEKYEIPPKSYVAILDHHEKYDGSGYPKGKCGAEISQFGRIISIADVYDALTSDRSYRKAMTPSEAMEYIMGSAGVLFDPELVMLFTRRIAPYPVGTCVKLSNNSIGLVLENYDNCCLRPKLRIFMEHGKPVVPFEINLKDDRDRMSCTILDVAEM